jgi:hypothetical protein
LGQIALVLSPWVPAKEVERTYRNLQRRLLGRDNRPVERRNLAIFKLGVEQARIHGKLPTWRSLLQRWNEIYPQGHEWHYLDVRMFEISDVASDAARKA